MTDQENGWSEQNAHPGAFNNILERVSHQFVTNQGSHHYQSGFIPATASPWTGHPSQHETDVFSQPLDPGIGISSPTLNQQMNINSRSYSVSQDLYSDCLGNQPPLIRSSSDLGMRFMQYSTVPLNFSHCQLDDILSHQDDTLDGSVFFNENSQVSLSCPVDASNVDPIQPSTSENEILNTSHIPYSLSYIEMGNKNFQQTNNFASKLSYFTTSLGTWFSPLEQVRSSYMDEEDGISNNGGITVIPNPELKIEKLETSINSLPPSNLPGHICHPISITPKPSYSDVLSKAPMQEGKSISSSGNASNHSNRNMMMYSNSNSHQRSRGEPSIRCSGKSKYRSSTFRSNSPNLPRNNVNNTTSKIGLDEFYLPENVTFSNSKLESFDKYKKRTCVNLEDSSPFRHCKKASKNVVQENVDNKQEDSPSSSDGEKSYCDQLNNQSLYNQQKQTPKRTAYINNNLAFSSGSKTNNTDSVLYQRKGNFRDEGKYNYDEVKSVGNRNVFNFGISSNKGAFRSSTPSFRSSRNSSTSKGDRVKEAQSKKYKRKKESSPHQHSDLLMAGWTVCLLWIQMLVKACFWLLKLIFDVLQMSARLFMHFGSEMWLTAKLQSKGVMILMYEYWTKFLSCFLRKKYDQKKSGRADRKTACSGLERNIVLPATGDEAMKRLLACRGKDPYSILGVTHVCTDDDIKKYYKRQAFLVHPDKNKQPGAEEAFKILAHAFEIIGEPEKREQYDSKLTEEFNLEGAWGELASLLNRLKEKLEEAANTIRCTNCNKRHKRIKLQRPIYAARHCAECQIKHAAREGDIWAESWMFGLRWKYFACMEGTIYDISEWAACQRDNLRHLQANTHSVQYRIVSGKRNVAGKNTSPECPTDPELEEFFNNLCREKFGQDFVPSSSGTSGDIRKRKGKKKK